MRIVWAPGAWQDYLYWSRTDVRVRDKINTLIEDIQRHRFAGLGKPEPLKRNLRGFWSRRITREHRLVYRIEAGVLQIAQCRFHY
ncbi:MAG: Txe/YoeB family addiction module toxin [Betaproteobacteria bacterium]|nr:Txe/YoeB family addiction module toxin [Betaproteobacteria bacterium]